MFPPLSSGVQNQPSTQQEFSTFAFWREPIVDLRLGKAVEALEVTEAASKTAASEAAPEPTSEPAAVVPVVDAAVKDKDEKAAAAAVAADPAQDKIL